MPSNRQNQLLIALILLIIILGVGMYFLLAQPGKEKEDISTQPLSVPPPPPPLPIMDDATTTEVSLAPEQEEVIDVE